MPLRLDAPPPKLLSHCRTALAAHAGRDAVLRRILTGEAEDAEGVVRQRRSAAALTRPIAVAHLDLEAGARGEPLALASVRTGWRVLLLGADRAPLRIVDVTDRASAADEISVGAGLPVTALFDAIVQAEARFGAAADALLRCLECPDLAFAAVWVAAETGDTLFPYLGRRWTQPHAAPALDAETFAEAMRDAVEEVRQQMQRLAAAPCQH